jgi:hypothetical protein
MTSLSWNSRIKGSSKFFGCNSCSFFQSEPLKFPDAFAEASDSISQTLSKFLHVFDRIYYRYSRNNHLSKISTIIDNQIIPLGIIFEESLISEKSVDKQQVISHLLNSLTLINKQLEEFSKEKEEYRNKVLPLQKVLLSSIDEVQKLQSPSYLNNLSAISESYNKRPSYSR